jgi:hypothetical protein
LRFDGPAQQTVHSREIGVQLLGIIGKERVDNIARRRLLRLLVAYWAVVFGVIDHGALLGTELARSDARL